MNQTDKRFTLQTVDGEVVMRDLTLDNVYVSVYGTYVPDYRTGHPVESIRVQDLPVDGVTRKEYALSGQKATMYLIVRTQ